MSLTKHKMIMCDSPDYFSSLFYRTKSSEILSVACALGEASANHHLRLSLEVGQDAKYFRMISSGK